MYLHNGILVSHKKGTKRYWVYKQWKHAVNDSVYKNAQKREPTEADSGFMVA